jgi:hypothetical protein
MAIYCIVKNKIDKLKEVVKSIGEKDQLKQLIEMSPEKRISTFKKFLTDEEAHFLNRELERSIAENKLSYFIKNNFDKAFREKKENANQLASIRSFIESNTNNDFKRITTSKRIDEIVSMSREERISFIDKYVKDKTKSTNFSNKIEEIVKAKEEAQLAKTQAKEEAQFGRTIIFGDKRFSNLQQVDRFIEKNIDGFVNESLGLAISPKEMEIFQELGDNVTKKRQLFEKEKSEMAQREYGKSLIELQHYTDSISENKMLSKNLVVRSKAIKEADLSKFDKAKEYAKLAGEIGLDLTTSVARTLMATAEVSFMTIQGAGKIATKNWWKNANKLFFKKMSTPEGFYNLQADIVGNPYYKQAVKDNLTFTIFGRGISKQEDNFTSLLLDQLANVGKGKWYEGLGITKIIGKAERAQSAFLTALRFDEYQKMMKMAELGGENMKVSSAKIAEQINDFTGGSYINPKINEVLSRILFSPRNTVASLKMFLDPRRYFSSSKVVRTESWKNIVSLLGITAVFTGLSILKDIAYGKKDTEINPTGSKFGKTKGGNTYYDYTFGKGTVLRLVSKMIAGTKKDSKTGATTTLGKNYGNFTEETRIDLLKSFSRGKLAPHASLLVDILDDFTNAVGEKLTLSKTAKEKLVPMYFNSLMDASKDPAFVGNIKLLHNALNGVTGFFAFAPEYSDINTKWEQKETKEMKSFKEEKGEEEMQKANSDYNSLLNIKFDELKLDNEFKKMNEEEKQKKLTKVRAEAKKEIFSKYNFTPPKN